MCVRQFGGDVGRARKEEALSSSELDAESTLGTLLQPVSRLSARQPRRQEVTSDSERSQL